MAAELIVLLSGYVNKYLLCWNIFYTDFWAVKSWKIVFHFRNYHHIVGFVILLVTMLKIYISSRINNSYLIIFDSIWTYNQTTLRALVLGSQFLQLLGQDIWNWRDSSNTGSERPNNEKLLGTQQLGTGFHRREVDSVKADSDCLKKIV